MAYRCSLACSAAETEGGSTQEILNIGEKCQTSAALNWFFLPSILPFRGIIALMLVVIYNFRTAANADHHIEKDSKHVYLSELA